MLTGLIISCTSSPDPAIAEAEAAKKALAEEHITLVKKFMAGFETGEVEAWREMCTDDFVTLGPGIDAEATLDEYIESMKGVHEAIDSLKMNTIAILPYTMEEGELAGDYVFWWGTNSGYLVKEGKSVKVMLHTVYKIKEGKIQWTADYWDTGDAERQLSGDNKVKKEEGTET